MKKTVPSWLLINACCIGLLIGVVVGKPPIDIMQSLFIVIPLILNVFALVINLFATSNVKGETHE